MKKTTLTLIGIITLVIFGCQKRPQIGIGMSTPPGAQVELSVTFEGVKCNGAAGICDVSKKPKEITTGVLAQRFDGKTIILHVDRKQISLERESKITGKPIPKIQGNLNYYIEEDIIIDQEVAQDLNLDTGYLRIAKGFYPMSYDKNSIDIRIALSK